MVLAIEAANIIRGIAITEILFCVGFLFARLWRHRRAPWKYLSLMAIALIAYSLFAAFVVLSRWNQPVSWQAPLVIIAATLSCVAVVREGIHPHEIVERERSKK